MNLRFFIFSCLLLLICSISFAEKEVPYLTGRVNDEANVLSHETVQHLEALLKQHEDSTSNQVVILTINSLEDEVLEEYSLRVAETWKIGQKDKDNGVLMLIVIEDRKMRIEVGYGLEGSLTDALSSQIIRNELAPNFRQGNYDKGITEGIHAIVAAIKGEYTVENSTADDISSTADIPWFILLPVGFVFLFVIGMFSFFAFMSRGGVSWFLFIFLLPFYATFPFILFGIIPATVVICLYFFGFLFFKIFYIRTPAGKKWFKASSTKWASSSSSSSSGWSSGGSSFSGGGGSFGGGGSSGSW